MKLLRPLLFSDSFVYLVLGSVLVVALIGISWPLDDDSTGQAILLRTWPLILGGAIAIIKAPQLDSGDTKRFTAFSAPIVKSKSQERSVSKAPVAHANYSTMDWPQLKKYIASQR